MGGLVTGEGLPAIVVTAVASTSALTADVEQTWQALLAGESGIRALDDAFVAEFGLPVRVGGHLREDIDAGLNRVELRRLSFLQRLALVIGRRVWSAAGAPEVDTTRLMVSVGTGHGGNEEIIEGYEAMKARGIRAISPLGVQKHMPNGPAATVGLDHQAKSSVVSPISADASGAEAIAQAWRQMVFGEADIAICGGVDIRIEKVPMAAFIAQGDVLSTRNGDPRAACRPFAADRDGTALGEGCALLVLETEAHAAARGAPILARLMGAAVTSDGYDASVADPTGRSAARAITRAIQLAGLTPADIGLIGAHAGGSVAGDAAEAAAFIAAGVGGAAVFAPKAALGHTFGASGAMEAAITVQALRDQVAPPTRNAEDLDPAIDLDVVTGGPRPGRYDFAVKNTSSMGGHNVALVFGRH